MRKKLLSAILLAVAALAAACAAVFFAACTGGDEYRWDVSGADGKITAYFSDNGKYGFILNVEGNGKMNDYSSVKDTPWYGKSGRVTDVVISEGITAIGKNAFTDCKAKTVVVPRTAVSIGENAFHKDAKVCVYSAPSAPEGVELYMYSETKPEKAGAYWRFKDGVATVWQEIKVLFIGNSFTFYSDIPSLFGKIAEAAGEPVRVESVTQGAWNLTKFADAGDEFGKKVYDKLRKSDDYDIVVLQEQSTRPLDNYTAFRDAAKSLKTKINSTQKNCRIYLYATWGYAAEAAARKMTIPQMEQEIRKAYEKAAAELGLSVSHVGKAFSKVYTEHSQKDRPDINLYFTDDKHPSYTGAFLSACVHAATLLGCDPRTSTFYGELDKGVAYILKAEAYNTVFGSL